MSTLRTSEIFWIAVATCIMLYVVCNYVYKVHISRRYSYTNDEEIGKLVGAVIAVVLYICTMMWFYSPITAFNDWLDTL